MAVVLITRGRFAIVCVMVAAAALAHHGRWSHWSNRYVIRNATGATLGAVHVVARHLDGRVAFEQTVADLPADSSAAIRHALDDSRLSLDFEMVGAARHFDADCIDLWKGEGWVLEIQSDGSVKQGYDYPGFRLQ